MDIADRLRQIELEIGSRRAEHQISPTLDRVAALTRLLGDPQHAFQVIHVTGTNGKTSTTRMIETLLRERGLRTGRFTSPHLVSMRERICVDGAPLPAQRFVELYEEISPYVDLVDSRQPVPLSFFEILTGMMFAAFADAPVDVAVIEVGLGGRWDATNVADGAVAVITPIALDHMQWLGDTIEEIATEKAGIIKSGAVAVLAQQPLEAAEVLIARAVEVGAAVAREGLEFGVLARELAVGGQQLALKGLRGAYADIYLPLFGAHQASNAACALAAVEAFAGVGETVSVGDDGNSTLTLGPGLSTAILDPDLVRSAFAKASSPGRLDILRRSPTVIADAAHNPAGMAVTLAALTESFTFDRVVGVVAVAQDKDVAGLLEELEPVLSDIVVTTNSSPRSMPADELRELARDIFGEERVQVAERLDDAIEMAVTLTDEADADSLSGGGGVGGTAVLVTGSVVTAGDAQLLLAPNSAVRADADGSDAAAPGPDMPGRHSFTLGELS